MAAIDIGTPTFTSVSSRALYNQTQITLNNPANATGILDTVKIYLFAGGGNGANVKVGTFYGSVSTKTNRDYSTLGAVTAGSEQTFSGLSIDVFADDVIGVTGTAGEIYAKTSGGGDIIWKAGDQFGGGSAGYTWLNDYDIALYATGVTIPPTVTTQVATIIVLGGATLNGNITDEGSESVSQHGFCWKSGSDPVNIAGADGSSTLGAGSEGAFDQAKTGLAEGTEFYYRAYATSTEGTAYGVAQRFTTGQTHSAAVAITPDAGVTAEATKIIEGACPIGVAVAQTAIGNRISVGACPITPAADIEAIANCFCGAECPIGIELGLSLNPGISIEAVMSMTPGSGVSAEANVIRGGVITITPAIVLVVAAIHLASAVVAITPEVDTSIVGNYFTCAVAAIAIAVSQSALCTKVVHGTVAITVDSSVAATAIRYLLTSIGYSGEFGAGSVLEINSDKMTFILDGVNAIKDIVGSFANVPPGDSTVIYEDDEGTRDVTLDLEYTPRDA